MRLSRELGWRMAAGETRRDSLRDSFERTKVGISLEKGASAS
jgi:hypothetical protein